MLKFTPDALTDLFLQQYMYEYGEKKAKEIFNKVETSPKIADYIRHLDAKQTMPSSKELALLLNSITFFIFSKSETLCLGKLATISLWQIRVETLSNILNEDEIIKICADVIVDSDKTKTHITDNFFSRFFRKIHQIEQQEG